MDELTRMLNLTSHILDQSSAEHRDNQEQMKADADKKLADSLGEAASKIRKLMNRIETRLEFKKDAVDWIREHGEVTHIDRELICGRVGKARIRIFPFGSELDDETPWAAVRGPKNVGTMSPAYFTFQEMKEAVETINGG
jgi:hypothetical protein